MLTIEPEQVQRCPRCGADHLGTKCPRCGQQIDTAGVEAQEESEEKPQMNKTEARYATRLDGLIACGGVHSHVFEGLKFRLADKTWYTPDFLVVLTDGRMELHEVKGGFIRDDAKVKYKVAREMFPMFGWRMMQWKQGEWREIA
jgi:hypothetical protein